MNAQPTSVPGDALSELLAEVPVELFFLVCAASMALVVFLMWLTYSRSRRNKTMEIASATMGQYSVGAASVVAANASQYKPMPPAKDPQMPDMPDLDLLLDTTTLTEGTAGMDDRTPNTPSPPTPPEPVPTRKQGISQIKLNTGDVIEAEEVIAVLRDPRDGRLVVQIDGVAYRTLAASPDVKKKFVQVMKQLSEVVTKPDDPSSVEVVQEQPLPEPAGTIPSEPEPPAPQKTSTAPKEPVSGPPPPMEDGTMPGDLPSFKLDDNKPPEGKDEKQAPIPEIDLAGAIEAYLQHKLKYTPQYNDRNIHVKPALDGGVRIQVDNNFYEAVGDVADSEIRDFLMATIQEWQERQTR